VVLPSVIRLSKRAQPKSAAFLVGDNFVQSIIIIDLVKEIESVAKLEKYMKCKLEREIRFKHSYKLQRNLQMSFIRAICIKRAF